MLTFPDPITKEESEKQTGETNKQIVEFCRWFWDLYGGGVLPQGMLWGTSWNNNDDGDSRYHLLSTCYVLVTS